MKNKRPTGEVVGAVNISFAGEHLDSKHEDGKGDEPMQGIFDVAKHEDLPQDAVFAVSQ